ncbi:TetR/AcrR family transcriptional regulator [Kitasatospora sp. CM 4170]|uniref:TetR/AcrR family transcriptional regulator n=1 Tax=Kitasatospora aburaviensis TaxID=67265 RepID=A0ABW1EUA5_9ACTN|nr:TetR/AcrR family transcriptional regulator [Kitasatospora sp. CM 4170]WNM43743.1 TetR/AcrR family transcriptional regulator [Kitasatospora sp. CM 4170]
MAEGSYHHGNLRTALLERAEAVLAESGADGLSLRSLARDLGVSHAAPSRHFRDRRALLDALAVSGFATLNGAMRAAAEAPDRPVTARLAEVGRAYLGFAVRHAALLDLMFTAKHAEDSSNELCELGHDCLEIVARLIAEAQRAGAVRDGDPVRLALVAFSATHGLAMLAVGSLLDDTPLADATDLTLDVLLAGLRPDPAGSP